MLKRISREKTSAKLKVMQRHLEQVWNIVEYLESWNLLENSLFYLDNIYYKEEILKFTFFRIFVYTDFKYCLHNFISFP